MKIRDEFTCGHYDYCANFLDKLRICILASHMATALFILEALIGVLFLGGICEFDIWQLAIESVL